MVDVYACSTVRRRPIAREQPTVTVLSMDVFMKLDNFGADLLTRTLGPLVGKTADYNFVESAKFVAQLYELCRDNPSAAQQLGSRMTKVDPAVRTKFLQVAARIAAEHPDAVDASELAQVETSRSKEPVAKEPVANEAATARATSRKVRATATLSDGAVIVPRSTHHPPLI